MSPFSEHQYACTYATTKPNCAGFLLRGDMYYNLCPWV